MCVPWKKVFFSILKIITPIKIIADFHMLKDRWKLERPKSSGLPEGFYYLEKYWKVI